MSIITGEGWAGEGQVPLRLRSSKATKAPYGATLTLTATLAAGCFLVVMAAVVLLVHPGPSQFDVTIIRQSQSAKSALYVAAFVLVLPAAVLLGPRLADRIAAGPNAGGLGVLSAVLAAALAAALVLARIIPGTHHGLHVVLLAVAVWAVMATGVLWRAALPRAWNPLLRLAPATPAAWGVAALAVIGVLLSVTSLGALSGVALALGAAAGVLILLAWGRMSLPSAGGATGSVVDLVVGLLLVAAITNVVVYHASSAIPNGIFPPGVIQFQQDWILAPANQLLSGGALLVNDPSSQYGVGLVYFLAAWFHLAPIGYGTFGFLDGLLTGLVYVGGYCVLRIARVPRILCLAGLGLAVTAFIYHFAYPVGSLPEQGPLRFGLPMVVIVGLVVGAASPRHRTTARGLALVAVGVSSVWAIEAFAYTTFTYLVMVAVEGFLRRAPGRRRWTLTQLALAAGACLIAHLILVLVTLAGSGHLPDWSQYVAYVHGLLLGGREGSVTYGFANWSPGLAVGAGCLFSAAALLLLLTRPSARARADPTMMLALAGSTAYAIAAFSYTDNRSSTYLFPYVALPVLLAAVLWLWLLLRTREVPWPQRRAGLAFALSMAVLMLAAAWSTIGSSFSQSALARAYPSGGLSSALHRLWHPPPIDPRAPAVERLLARHMPQKHVLVLLPAAPDLAIEALMRSGRGSSLFLGDPAEDMWIPSVWMPRVTRQIESLRSGSRVLLDRTALLVTARLRHHGANYTFRNPLAHGNPEIEWILHRLDQSFRIVPVNYGPDGLIVARLDRRMAAG